MHQVVKTLLQYSSITLLERERYEGEVQPYPKTDYKPMMMNVVSSETINGLLSELLYPVDLVQMAPTVEQLGRPVSELGVSLLDK